MAKTKIDFTPQAEEANKKIDTYITGMKGKDVDSLKSMSKTLKEEIKKLREFINGTPQTKQGYGQVPQVTVMNQYQQANMGISSKAIEPGQQEKMLVERAATMIEEAVKQANAIKEGIWKNYMDMVKAAKLDPFGK